MATEEDVPLSSKHAEVMVVRRETYIRTPAFRIISELASILAKESDQSEFMRFCGKVESLLRASYSKKFSRLLNLYTYFDPIHGGRALERDGYNSEQQITEMETEFLDGLSLLLNKSSFHLLTEQQFRMATSSQFLLQLPVQVDTTKIDTGLLERYFLHHKEADKDLPSFSHHYLIFTRGYGVVSETGMFVQEKLNVALGNVFRASIGRLLPKRKGERERHLAKVRVALRRQSIGSKPQGLEAGAGQSPVKGIPLTPSLAPLETTSNHNDDGDDGDGSRNFERVRLENFPLLSKEWFKPTTIKEPTFQNVFVLYRPALEGGGKKGKQRRRREAEEREQMKKELLHRAIVMRQFGDIPMADLEIVFPEKRTPNLTPMDWITILVTTVMGVAALFGIFKQKVMDTTAFKAAGIAVMTYIGRIYTGFQTAQKKYAQALADIVYARQLDSGRGTLLNLFQQVVDQELKETVVAYYILLTQGKSNTDELEARCEDLMADEFEEHIDFDTHDACDKLLRLGIVSKDAQERFFAVTMKRANDILGSTTDEVVGEVLGTK